MPKHNYTAITTFTRSPSPAQILSYVVILLELIIFYVMIRPSIINKSAAITFTVLYSLSLGLTFITTFICSFVDPSDSAMIDFKNGNFKNEKWKPEQLLYCEYCHSYVHPSARHCRQCDRCVENFDHHCMWINNCIGVKNYRVFIAMIFSTFINMVIFISATAFLTVENSWNEFIGFMVTSWVTLFIICILAFLLLNLIILHVYLCCKGYTTYQFIMARREEERREEMKKAEEEVKRRAEEMRKLQAIKRRSRKHIVEDELRVSKLTQHEQREFSTHKSIPFQADITPHKSKRGDMEETVTKIKVNNHFPQSDSKISKNQSKCVQFLQEDEKKKDSIIFGVEAESANEEDSNGRTLNFAEKTGGNSGFYKKNQMQINIEELSDVNLKERIGSNGSESWKVEEKRKKGTEKHQKQLVSSESQEQIRISQFFTRNKSLNFLILNDVAEKPQHKRMPDLSLQLQEDVEPPSQVNMPNTTRVQVEKNKKSNKKLFSSNEKQKTTSIDRKNPDHNH